MATDTPTDELAREMERFIALTDKPERTAAYREDSERFGEWFWDNRHAILTALRSEPTRLGQDDVRPSGATKRMAEALGTEWQHDPKWQRGDGQDDAGGVEANAESMIYMREIAQGMGYPSVLEALEHLDDLRAPKPTPTDAAVDRVAAQIMAALRSANLFATYTGERQDEFEATVLTPILAAMPPADNDAMGLLREAREALNAMMDAWFDYHDTHSLTQPVTGLAGSAFDRAIEARERIDARLASLKGDG